METLAYQIVVPFVTAFLGGFAGWFFKRKRLEKENEGLDSENDRKDIANIDAAVETWQKVVKALEEQISKLLAQRQEDSRKIEELSLRVSELQGTVDGMRSRLKLTEKLEKKVARYERILAENGIAY